MKKYLALLNTFLKIKRIDKYLIKDIPVGDYCYSGTGKTINWNGIKIPKWNKCPYFQYNKFNIAKCYYLYTMGGFLLQDMCKECGIKIGDKNEIN